MFIFLRVTTIPMIPWLSLFDNKALFRNFFPVPQSLPWVKHVQTLFSQI